MTKTKTARPTAASRAFAAFGLDPQAPNALATLALILSQSGAGGLTCCSKCWGSGAVNSTLDGGVCWACGGRGYKVPGRVTVEMAEAAEASLVNGRHDAWRVYQANCVNSRNATKRVLDAWTRLELGKHYNWSLAVDDRKAGRVTVHTRVSDLNSGIHAEFAKVKALAEKVDMTPRAQRGKIEVMAPLMAELAELAKKALERVELARPWVAAAVSGEGWEGRPEWVRYD